MIIDVDDGNLIGGDKDRSDVVIEPSDQSQAQEEQEKKGEVIEISEDEFEFDFLDWLDQQEVRTRTMREFESEIVQEEEIPWPEVAEILEEGIIEIKFVNKAQFRPCTVC